MSTGKSTGSTLPAGRRVNMVLARVPTCLAIGWMAAAVLGAVAPAAKVVAWQPILDFQPMQVRGDTLHHVDNWDVRYGALPELRLAALPQVTGPARATPGGTTTRVEPVQTPPAARRSALETRTTVHSRQDAGVAAKLASLPVVAVGSPIATRQTPLVNRAQVGTSAGTDLAKGLATLPVIVADNSRATPKTLPEQRTITTAPVAANPAKELATVPIVVTDARPAAPRTMAELPIVAPAAVDATFAESFAVAVSSTPMADGGQVGDLHGTDNRRIAPARFAQLNGDQQIPRPSYLDPDSQPDAVPPEPSYLESDEENLTVEEHLERLRQRVFELETAQTGHEDATRSIIRQSFAEQGSNINDYVIFGGTIETLTFWARDFDDVAESDIVLDTAELDFEIQVNPWTLGSLVIEYEDGGQFSFLTDEDDAVFVDRFNVRQAIITVGDIANYPPYATFGRAVVPFGISTGDPVADVLTITDPLTVEVFETHEDFVMLGFVYPVCCPPPLDPNAPPGPPPVQGMLINPLVRRVATSLFSYCPCTPPPKPPTPLPWMPTCTSPFSTAIYFYNGETIDGIGEDHIEHIGGTMGYFTRGVLPYRCLPWSLDLDVDVTSSVFDSDFLQHEYRAFLDQIGYVPGMAAHAKVSVGPTAYIVEWNGALIDAEFVDEAAVPVTHNIRPQAWQISFAYQFGWHRLVEVIGAQGTYFTMGYSESQDLSGATRAVGDPLAPTLLRVGNVAERRISVGMGEWVMPGVRVALEYSHEWDYDEGLGTGNGADGVFWQMTYEW